MEPEYWVALEEGNTRANSNKGQSGCPHRKGHDLVWCVFGLETKGSASSLAGVRVWKGVPLRELWMEKRNSFETDLAQLLVRVLSPWSGDSVVTL